MRFRPLLVASCVTVVLGGSSFFAWKSRHAPQGEPSLPGIPNTPLVYPEQVAEFVGSGACAGCHPHEHVAQSASAHANTLSEVAGSEIVNAFRSDQKVRDAARGVTYSQTVRDGKAVSLQSAKGDPRPLEMSPKYALGSGRIATTFLYEQNGRFGEARTTYYNGIKKWDWTPGQQYHDPARPIWGKPLPERTAAACFLCHSTAVAHDGARVLPEKSIFNIGCERCHGPGREHIEAVGRGKAPGPIYSLKSLSADMVLKLCDECHRSPVSLSEGELRGFANLPRFAGPGFALSKCYKQGEGKLSCLSCHNPHGETSKDLRSYDRVCGSCHNPQAGHRVVCPKGRTENCVSCHMPELPVEFPIPMKFRTHWIKAYPESALTANH